jgi:protein transport protein SEC13
VAWSHPKYESLVATCGYDRSIKVWKEVAKNNWRCVHRFQAEASVNCIQFAPQEYGLGLVAGSADGKILVLDYQSHFGNWAEPQKLPAHNSGVTSVSWGPPQEPCLLMAEQVDQQKNAKDKMNMRPRRFVSGGMDMSVKIWKENPGN